MVIMWLWMMLARKHKEPESGISSITRVSVVVACRNAEKTITALLESLVSQDYPSDLFEIIIINDHSTDRTPVAVSEFISKHRQNSALNIRLLYNLSSGKKSAIRFGVRHSSSDLILTTDADCTVGSGWISAYAGFYSATGADMILGEVCQTVSGGFISHFGRLEFRALQSVTRAAVFAGHPVMCNGANMCFRRDIYLRHAGELRDDIASGDDIFLLHAVKRGGGVIMYNGSRAAAAVTAAAGTAAALLRQRARWASKSFFYRDTATLALAAATAACNAAVAAAAIAAAFSHNLTLPATLYTIRLIPDYLIIHSNLKEKEEHTPLLIFLISELIYPFYFVAVALLSLVPSSRKF